MSISRNFFSAIIIIEVFETLALLLLIAAPVVLIIKMFVKPMKTYLRFVVMGLLIAAGKLGNYARYKNEMSMLGTCLQVP